MKLLSRLQVAVALLSLAPIPLSASAGTSILDSKLVSKPPGGKAPDEGLYDFGISRNGRFLVFSSRDADFLKGANPPATIYEIYWIDRQTGETRLVSRNANGDPGDDDSSNPRVSDDGRHVTFLTLASNFGAPANVVSQVAYADVKAGTAKIISKTWNGTIANDHCYDPEISGDGRIVAFTTRSQTLLGVLAPTSHVLVYDSTKDTLDTVSFNSDGAWANDNSYHPFLGKDGRFVSFQTFATNLPDANGGSFTKIVVHDRKTGDCALVTKSQAGVPANDYVHNVTQSRNGRFVAFVSTATNLVPLGSPVGERALYVIDRTNGKVARQPLALDSSLSEGVVTLSVSDSGKRVAATCLYDSSVLPNHSIGRVRVFDFVQHTEKLLQITSPAQTTAATDTIGMGFLTANGKKLYFETPAEALNGQLGPNDQVYQLNLGKP